MERKIFEDPQRKTAEQGETPVIRAAAPVVEAPVFDDEAHEQKVSAQQITDKHRQDEIRESLGILPAKNKRFRFGREDFAQERQQAVKDSVREIKLENPEILSFCMFGSMAKGRARLESDIDGFLFIDADKIANKSKQSATTAGIERKEDEFGSRSKKAFSKLRIDLESNYINTLRNKIKQKTDLTDNQLEDIKAIPISRQIIDQQLEELRKSFEEPERYETQAPSFLDENKMVTMENEVIAIVGDNLSKMFHLETGGGIREYRKYLLDKLSDLGEIGEKIWREIIDSTATMEHGSLSVARYPETLKEARKIYGK